MSRKLTTYPHLSTYGLFRVNSLRSQYTQVIKEVDRKRVRKQARKERGHENIATWGSEMTHRNDPLK
jgi:hypothetical protein